MSAIVRFLIWFSYLLTCLVLHQHHRVGRLLIPYLNPTKYYGVEPNKWAVKDGSTNDIGNDLI